MNSIHTSRRFLLRKNLQQLPNAVNMFCGSLDDRCQDVIFFEGDVAEALSKLREDKAAGPDDLSPRLLLQIKDQIRYPLFLLFRKSLDKGIVPTLILGMASTSYFSTLRRLLIRFRTKG